MKRLVEYMESSLNKRISDNSQSFDIYLEFTCSESKSQGERRLTSETFLTVSDTMSHVADSMEVKSMLSSTGCNTIQVSYMVDTIRGYHLDESETKTVAVIRFYQEYQNTVIELNSTNDFLNSIANLNS